mgnify:CR=1 FL=1
MTKILNPTVGAISTGVSVITAIKDREENLKKSLESWLGKRDINEIVIVDWDSKKPIRTFIDIENNPKIVLVEVRNQPKWILAEAFNLAARFSTKDKILKLDADIVLKKDFFEKNGLKKKKFICGNWKKARNKNEKHLSGVLYCFRNDFFANKGYDEKMRYYGQEDIDLYNRLVSFGLKRKDVNSNTLFHIDHPNSLRTINQEKIFFGTENLINRIRIRIRNNQLKNDSYQNFTINIINNNHYILEKNKIRNPKEQILCIIKEIKYLLKKQGNEIK